MKVFSTFMHKVRRCASVSALLPVVVLPLLFEPALDVQCLAEETGTMFEKSDLVSPIFGRAENSDSSLVDPWGMARSSDGPWWVANGGSGRATVYSGAGVALPGLAPLVVTIPVNPGGIYDYSTPTGVVYNGSSAFELAPEEPALYIFVTSDGTIAGWNSDVDRWNAVLVVDNSPYALYTGVTIATLRGRPRLYVADFAEGRVEVYNTDFDAVTSVAGAFTDSLIPPGFSPYNVQNIGNRIYVTYAQRAGDGRNPLTGDGLGYVDVFDTAGHLMLRLQPGSWMNAPWGVTRAPVDFGDFNNDVLVGNFGSGRIAAFDLGTGTFRKYITDMRGTPITVPGLHGLGFGNDGLAGPAATLYFTAGGDDTDEDWGASPSNRWTSS